MKLLQDFFKFLFSRLVTVLILLLVLGGVAAFYPEFQQAQTELLELERKLQRSTRQVEWSQQALARETFQLKQLEKDYRALSWWHPSQKLALRTQLTASRKLCAALSQQSAAAVAQVKKMQQQCGYYRQTFWGRLVYFMQTEALAWGLWALGLMFVAPLLWKIFMYYGVARLVAHFPPVVIALRRRPRSPQLVASNVAVDFPVGSEKLYLRSGEWGKKRTDLTAHTKILWRYRYPLISIAANLCELIVLQKANHSEGKVTITSPYPDVYIARIDLKDCDGLVIRPKFLVGLTEHIEVETKWNFSWHNILSMRVRQIILRGEGTVFLAGSWGVDIAQGHPEADNRIEDNLLLAYEPSAEYSLAPTETFWHYLRGQSSLFDQKLKRGVFFTQNNTASNGLHPESTLERVLGFFFNGIGKFFGF